MKSYFFIPGNKAAKLQTIKDFGVDEVIIDLEDAVKGSERESIIKNFQNIQGILDCYIRVPIYKNNDFVLDLSLNQTLYEMGFRKFVFPKLVSKADFLSVRDTLPLNSLSMILLIETPRFFLECQDVLLKNSSGVKGIGLGSHDFLAEVGANYNLQNLEFARTHILYLAKALGITAIDIASMDLKDEKALSNEIEDGFKKGYDAKFFIHPWQLEVKNKLILYNENDLLWAKTVKLELEKVNEADEFNPIVINNQIIEKPHLIKMKKILDYFNYGSK